MSVRIIAAVLRAKIRPAGRKLVALALASAAADDGRRIFPGEKRLVRETSLEARSVRRHVRELIADGIVVEVRSAHAGTRREFAFDLGALQRFEKADVDDRHKADASDRLSGRKGGRWRPQRRTQLTAKADAAVPPYVLNRPLTSSKAVPIDNEEAKRTGFDHVGSPWPNLPETLIDAELEPSILHLLDAAVAVAEEPIAEAEVPTVVGLVRANRTGVVIEALRGIVAEHRDGNGGPIRSVPKLLRFAIKEASAR